MTLGGGSVTRGSMPITFIPNASHNRAVSVPMFPTPIIRAVLFGRYVAASNGFQFLVDCWWIYLSRWRANNNIIDIIKEQIAIANTGNTTLTQDDIKPRGHAIECRINAEDPSKNFQPSPGIINVCHQPSGFRTRVDGAIFQGCKITPYYDSLICKLICQGRDRTEAIQRTLRSLDEFVIEGITTTIDLHKKILNHKKFINSDYDVNWPTSGLFLRRRQEKYLDAVEDKFQSAMDIVTAKYPDDMATGNVLHFDVTTVNRPEGGW